MNPKTKYIAVFPLMLFFMVFKPTALAQQEPAATPAAKGAFIIDGLTFNNREEYYRSEYFQESGRRCGTPSTVARQPLFPFLVSPREAADCAANSTNPTNAYDSTALYEITVVVHIIENTNGDGAISEALVASQIEILNHDFLAMAGTPGANGVDVEIRFKLATQDPSGNPTTGITRSVNDAWFDDGDNYWETLAWDPNRYMNIYTNSAGGDLGYVPFLPADSGGSLTGDPSDRVVILWSAFGRGGEIGPPFDQGRTTTHEVGHFLGLEHTFLPDGSCPIGSASPPECYSSGDFICDTNPEQEAAFGCPVDKSSCDGSLDAITNYMNYADDACMETFSVEQARRIRCSLESYRSGIYTVITQDVGLIHKDGFENE